MAPTTSRPRRARWFYASSAGVLALALAFAPPWLPLQLALIAFVAWVGYWLGRREDLLFTSSVTDPLTGLFNRRYFELSMLRELARSERDGSALALLMIDIDGMKQFNDHGGHDAGDLALKAVAEALRRACRGSDLVSRWGGDEFVVLAPMTSEADAVGLARRINDELLQSPVRVSVGVGMAVARESSAQLFATADAALYRHKARHLAVVPVAVP